MSTAKHVYIAAGLIVLALGVFALFFLQPPADMYQSDKCSYPAYARTHGGSYDACIKESARDAARRLMRGY